MNAHDFWLKVLKDCYEFQFPTGRTVKAMTFPTDRAIWLQYEDLQKDLTAIARHPMPENSVIIDLGACIGLWAMWAACLYPKARIYAVEPMPHNFDNLKANAGLNGFDNITPINCAVTADGRSTTLYQHPLNAGSASLDVCNVEAFREYLPRYNVLSMKLDSLMDTYGIEFADFVKMDIEGGEYEILESMPESTWDRIGKMSVELHGEADKRAPAADKLLKNPKVILV